MEKQAISRVTFIVGTQQENIFQAAGLICSLIYLLAPLRSAAPGAETPFP